jgi:NAD(P)-dependent dehydrogenase (short-subunit alcohol dehydrogenase family)
MDGPATVLPADLTEPGEAERIVAETLAAHGRIDVIVHSAGVFEKASVPEATAAHWRRVMDINLDAVMALTRAGWEALSGSGGQIVLISSIAAVQAFEGNAAYAASKGGLNALGEVLRLEGRDRGIRVITLCPAQIDTELWDGKAPAGVRGRMMPVEGVGGLVADLVGTDRRIDIGPVVIRPVKDPWVEPEP